LTILTAHCGVRGDHEGGSRHYKELREILAVLKTKDFNDYKKYSVRSIFALNMI